MTLRIAGHGLPARDPGAPPGHLFVTVTSAPDSRFQRRGADLWRSETLQVDEAALGCKRTVPTLDGEVEVTVPPGTQPDEVLRLHGKGLPHFQSDTRGNLNLRIQVHIPETLSPGEEAAYRQLRACREKGPSSA